MVGLNLGGLLEPAMLRTYNLHDMPPLHSAHISPSYDEFLASLRRDLTFEKFVAAMRFAPPQFPVVTPAACASLPVVHRSRHPPRHGKRGHSKRPHASALCALMSFRMLMRPCWPLICVMSVLTGSALLR